MDNTLLIGLSRQMSLQRRMDVIANNMANVDTAGYKGDSVQFEEFIMPVATAGGFSGKDARLSFVQDRGLVRDMSAGRMEPTGNDLDVAISGDGWFAVQTPDGERYTRNGQFKLNAEGALVTTAGQQVLGEGGTLSVPADESGVEIATDGTFSTSAGQKGRLKVVSFPKDAKLEKTGGTLFSADKPAEAATDVRVMQGMVEKSNVDPVLELTRMIDTARAYESVSRTLERTDELRRDAIGKLGRLI